MRAIIVLSLLLIGCEAPKGSITDSSGKVVGGQSDVRELTRAESRVSIVGDDSFVSRRQGMSLPSRWGEMLSGNGFVWRYEKLHASGFDPSVTPEERMTNSWSLQFLSRMGASLRGAKPQTMAVMGKQITYTFAAGGNWNCLVFATVFGQTRFAQSYGDEAFYGVGCLQGPNNSDQALEARARDLMGRIRFDDGLLNRAKQ
jgi:hypothetical protein